MSIEIGVSKHGRKAFTKYKNFYLLSEFDKGGVKGGHNIFRVLPPLKSLAGPGFYYAFHKVHKGFVGTDGKPRYFRCIQEYDFKKKMITAHCPICDLCAEKQKALKVMEEKGATKEQLSEAREAFVQPLMAEGRYYVNIVNQAEEIGILALPSKSFKALKDLANGYDEKGFDITGTKGLFLDFKKVSAYKGDNQVLYPVEVYREAITGPNGLDEKPKIHVLTEAIINRLESEAADLDKDLFTSITSEQMITLVNCKGEDRKKMVDYIFGKPEEKPEEATNKAGIAGTNATAVGRMELGTSGLDVKMPDVASIGQAPTPTPPPAAVNTQAGIQPQVATPAAPVQQQMSRPVSNSISEEEFDKIFANS